MSAEHIIAPLIAFSITVISLTLSHRKNIANKKYFIITLLVLNLSLIFFTIKKENKNRESFSSLLSSIQNVKQAIEIDKLKDFGFLPDEINNFIKLRDQLDILAKSVKADSLVTKVYATINKAWKVRLIVIPGMVDSTLIQNYFSKNTGTKIEFNNNYEYLTANTVFYSDNLDINHVRGFLYIFTKAGIQIKSVEKTKLKDYSTIELGFKYENTFREAIEFDSLQTFLPENIYGDYINYNNGKTNSRFIPRPVNNLSGYKKNNIIYLEWETPNQTDLSMFEIRYSNQPITSSNYFMSELLNLTTEKIPHPFGGQKQRSMIKTFSKELRNFYTVRLINLMGQYSIPAIIEIKE